MHWPLSEAKAHFSAVIAKAATEGPQVITKFGDEEAVLLSMGDYQRLLAAPSFKEYLQSMPAIELDRAPTSGRDISL